MDEHNTIFFVVLQYLNSISVIENQKYLIKDKLINTEDYE